MQQWMNRYWLFGCCVATALAATQVWAFQQQEPAEQPQQPAEPQQQPAEQPQPQEPLPQNQNQIREQDSARPEAPRINDAERDLQPRPDGQAPRGDQAREGEEGQKDRHTGEFVRLDDGTFSMTIEGERKHSHRISEETQVLINGQQGRLQDLREGDEIRVTMGADNLALKVEAIREDRPSPRNGQLSPREDQQDRGPAQAGRMDERRSRGPDAGLDSAELGLNVQPSPTTGVFLQSVNAQSPAATSGLRQGDYILSINGLRIESPEHFHHAMSETQAGDRLQMEIWRNNQRQQINITFQDQRQAGFRGTQQEQFDGQGRQGDQARQSQSWIGVTMRHQEPQHGVRIEGVQLGGPAAQAGLAPGDIVVVADGYEVLHPEELAEIIGSAEPGQTVELHVVRRNQQITMDVIPASRTPMLSDRGTGAMERRVLRPGLNDRQNSSGNEYAGQSSQHEQLMQQHDRIEERLEVILNELQEIRRQLGSVEGPGAAREADLPRERPVPRVPEAPQGRNDVDEPTTPRQPERPGQPLPGPGNADTQSPAPGAVPE